MNIALKQPEDAIQDTKQYIIDAARELFSEYSYLGVSMSDIAKKLNITKAALYYHFTGKAEVYEKVLDDVFYDLDLTIAQALRETTIDKKLHKLIKNYLDFGFGEKNLIKAFLLKLPPADAQITRDIIHLKERLAHRIRPIVEEVVVDKKWVKKINSQLLTSMLMSMMDGLILEYSFIGKKANSAKVANQIIAVLF
jgi:AcrR family transcriptional regulator